MGDITIPQDELVHLIRMGVIGDSRQFSSLARRLGRRLKRDNPDVGDKVMSLITDASNEKAETLRRAPYPQPTDPETRHELLTETNDTDVSEPALPKALRDQIDQLVLEQQQRRKLEKAGLSPARTGLFVGPPGVGKTMTARWVAAKLGRPLYTLNLAATASSLLGRTGGNIRDALQFAQRQPSVLLLDEIDAIGKRRDSEDVGEAKRIVTVLLQEIDRWPAHSLLLAATNHSELLDRAIWRRFDVQIEFPLATQETALRAALSAFGGSDDSNLSMLIAKVMDGQPLSSITSLVHKARKRSLLFNEDVFDAVVQLSSERWRDLSRTESHTIALSLIDAGFSQRRVNEITGISRDTLRKKVKGAQDG